MSVRHDPALIERVRACTAEGLSPQRIADACNTSRATVRRIIAEHNIPAHNIHADNDALRALYSRVDRVEGDQRTVELRTTTLVETVEQAIAAAGIDTAVWQVAKMETRHYPLQTADGVQQGSYVKLHLGPSSCLSDEAQVAALVDGVLASRTHQPATVFTRFRTTATKRLAVLVINDVHFAKLAWAGSTGDHNWNLRIAKETLLAAVAHLVDALPPCDEVLVALLGDIFHYDTLAGTTTGGTAMDRDSRTALMLATGAETITRCIQLAALIAPTRVITVPGNHDAVLTLALQRILVAEFRGTSVRVDETYTRRKPVLWGRTLLQFDHGDKARKKLAHMLPQEHPQLWGQSVYREIHTGHLHTDAETVNATFVEQGVVVRTHPALCPSDQWHFDEGFTGSPRGMQAFVYHSEGALEQVIRFDPRVHLEQVA